MMRLELCRGLAWRYSLGSSASGIGPKPRWEPGDPASPVRKKTGGWCRGQDAPNTLSSPISGTLPRPSFSSVTL